MRLLASLLLAGLATGSLPAAAEWNRFRGPNGSGQVNATGLPVTVNEGNTLWKIPVGKGWSSPVLWGDLVVLTAETSPNQRAVIAYAASNGRELWRHEEAFEPHKMHSLNSLASSTPFIDDRRIYINWSAGNKIQALALDHQGKLLWRNGDIARYIHEHGTGVSPVVVDGIMIVRSEFSWRPEEAPGAAPGESWPACLVGLDAATGKQVWKREIPHCHNTYSTPLVRELGGGKREVICANNGSGVLGLDPKTGAIRWQHNPRYKQRSVGSGVLHDEFYFCTFGTGAGVNEVAALDLKGGAPRPIPFEIPKGLPYVPSPLVLGDLMYLLGDGGVLRCVEFKTGRTIYEERLEGSTPGAARFFSSPVAADGKIYCGSQRGDLIVIKPGPAFERLGATNLGGTINATPAIADGRLYVRTATHLWCVGRKTTAAR